MTIMINNVVWSAGVMKYFLLEDHKATIIPGKYRVLGGTEVPITINALGYSCFMCQGFIKQNERHVCRCVKPIYDFQNGMIGYSYEET